MKKIEIKLLFKLFTLLAKVIPSKSVLAKKIAFGSLLLTVVNCDDTSNNSSSTNIETCYDPIASTFFVNGMKYEESGSYVQASDSLRCSISLYYDELAAYAIVDTSNTILQSGIFKDDPQNSYDTTLVLDKEKFNSGENYRLLYQLYDENMNLHIQNHNF